MSMIEWAENEIRLATKVDQECMVEGDKESIDYVKACYNAALDAYKMLCDQEHSGMSFQITKSILIDLMNQQPLTPLEDTDDDWNLVGHREEYDVFQHKRRSSLFKETHPDKTVYHDTNRVQCHDIKHHNVVFYNGFISELVHEMFPIYFPYTPSKKRYEVYREDFLFDTVNGGDFDTMGVFYLVTPTGEKIDINKYYKEYKGEYWKEISYEEYLHRKSSKKVKVNKIDT